MNFQTPLRDIDQLKSLAKKAKATHPELSHSQRLDLVARDHSKARNFREIRKRATAEIEQYLAPKGSGTCECNFCGLLFVPSLTEDVKAHEKRHLKYEEALFALGRLPAQYHEREEKKKLGNRLASEAENAADELAAVEMMVLAWFDRSLDSAIKSGYWKQHPTFAQYAAMISPAAQRHLRLAADLYRDKYGPNPGGIPDGQSYWYPPKA